MADNDNTNSLPPVYQGETLCRPPFDLVNMRDSSLANTFVAEHINIGGAVVNIFKLLGIHEQGKLVDLAGEGTAMSSGDATGFPASNAFTDSGSEWQSSQTGSLVTSSAYIGYDFGPITLNNGRLRYGIDTANRQLISTIAIKQGAASANRITKARVERSDDAKTWYGVAIITLEDTANEVQISFRQTAASRYWRLRPTAFNGSNTDYWSVVSFKLYDYQSTYLSNFQDDMGFFENRDRQYADQSTSIKGFYDLIEVQTELSRFGIDLPSQQYVFRVSFSTVVQAIGRPIVIGDVLEIPSEVQYTPEMVPVRKFLEVTDVGWATEGFTPGWVPTIQRVIAMPMLASQETRDIVGDLNMPSTANNFQNLDDQNFSIEALLADQAIQSEASSEVLEGGTDIADTRTFMEDEIATAAQEGIDLSKLNQDAKSGYVEDGMPPNGEPYTEGYDFPTSPSNGDYHRMTYQPTQSGDIIPPRLFKYSLAKNRWIFVEEDKRMRMQYLKPSVHKFLADPSAISSDKIGK